MRGGTIRKPALSGVLCVLERRKPKLLLRLAERTLAGLMESKRLPVCLIRAVTSDPENVQEGFQPASKFGAMLFFL